MQDTRPDGGSGARSHNNRWIRIIPIAIIVYIIAFMDRTNIGFGFSGMQESLGFGATEAGFAGGIFFVGYLFLQIPGGHLAEHRSAKNFVGILLLIWGVFAILTGLVQSYGQLLIVRFLLGVAEGGVWPAILVLISHWFPAEERARAYGFWIINIPIASIITSPLSGWIVSNTDWRWLFIVEGIFPFIVAPLWWWLVADHPSEASWVSETEREYIESALTEERRNAPESEGYRQVLRSGTVWKLVVVYFLIQVGFYGLTLWLPTALKELTRQGFGLVGLIGAIPYVVAILGLLLNGWLADKTGKYSSLVFASMLIAAICLVASVVIGENQIVLSIALLSLAMGGALAYDGPFWAAASEAVPPAVVGGAMGLVNAIGNLGGFVGPYLGGYLQDRSNGSFVSTDIMLAAALLLAGLVMLTVRVQRRRATAAAPA